MENKMENKPHPKADYIDGIVFGFFIVFGMWFGLHMIP
jgi:hypothetical protein